MFIPDLLESPQRKKTGSGGEGPELHTSAIWGQQRLQSEPPCALGWRDTASLSVPREAMLWIVTHQTTGAEDGEPPGDS